MNAYYFDSDIMIFDTGLTPEYQKFSMKKRETTRVVSTLQRAAATIKE